MPAVSAGAIPTLDGPDDMAAGVAALAQLCPAMAATANTLGIPPLRRYSAGFDGLARIVVGQQLSTASANAIATRLSALIDPLDAPGLLAATEDALFGAGLSRAKVATLRALADQVVAGRLDMARMSQMSDDDIRTTLVAVRGIGPWTADVYLLFALGRADAFAAGDLALQVGTQHLLGLEAKPSRREMEAIAVRWAPWRGVAAHVLWAVYAARARAPQPAARSAS